MNKIISEYIKQEIEVLESFEQHKVEEIYHCIKTVYNNGGRVYLIGNGGSSANASHWVKDLKKNIKNTDNGFDIISLTDNVPLLTAYANDVEYSKIFLQQIANRIREIDVIIALSVSGSSSNLVKAFQYANEKKFHTISVIADYDGELKEYSDIALVLNTQNYGIAEDIQQTINHILVQLLQASAELSNSSEHNC